MNCQEQILIVEDEQLMREIVRESLEIQGYSPLPASNAQEARALAQGNRFDLLITDLNMPGENGIDLIKHFRRHHPETSIVVITGYPDEERLKTLQELGVAAFLTKPFTVTQLKYTVLGALTKHRTARENARVDREVAGNSDLGLVGVSDYIAAVRKQIRSIASGDFPVLIQGESGTGKEVIAHAIHHLSPRRGERMVTINCGAIPHHLEESEFFGHAKGAFTGAHCTKLGILESADKSTVFLDEIGELSLPVQAKLLRVLDTGEFLRVGDLSPRKVAIRIISATNKNLERMVGEGTFRKDLFFRLRGATVQTQPLNRHPEDIPHLVRFFLNLAGCEAHITSDAVNALLSYDWPGSVRELKHVTNQLAFAARGQPLINRVMVAMVINTEDTDRPASLPFIQAREQFEQHFFQEALRRTAGNLTRAALDIGLHRPNLIRKLKELGIHAERFRTGSAPHKAAASRHSSQSSALKKNAWPPPDSNSDRNPRATAPSQ